MQERFQSGGRRRGVLLLVTLLILATSVPLGAQDSAKAEADQYRRAARKAEAEYERLSRRLAPATFGSGSGECDEIVGRFCLRFDSGPPRPIPPEAPRVVRARRDAVEALRRAFAAAPGDLRVAGALVRYLVEDGRPEEAVSAAEAFAWATEDSTWKSLLVGFGLHARGDDVAALAHFEEGLARLPPAERRRFERVDVLLAHPEESFYRKLDEAEQERYERDLWIMADPLYLTPGNEARAEHYARHVWARLLSEAPVVFGMVSWGRDLDELTLRYGVPAGRERVIASWSLDAQIVERFDPDQLAFVPERLRTEGVPETPAPGDPWPLEHPRARSGLAPVTIRRMVPFAHQVTRFPAGDSVVLRVDGALALDSVAVDSAGADKRVSAALFVLDSAFTRIAERRRSVAPVRDTVYVSFEEVLPPGTFVYSLEALEETTRFAGRARYSVSLAGVSSADSLSLSDPLLAWPYGRAALPRERGAPSLRPRASLELAPVDTVGIYAEVSGLAAGGDDATHYRIEVSMRRTDAAGLSRAVRWLGRLLGLAGPDRAPRVSWEGAGEPGRTEALAVDLDLGDLDPGLYVIELAVQDLVAGTRRDSRKAIRIVKPD